MSIREVAWAAWEASREDYASEARGQLSARLAPADVSGLTVEHVDVASSYTLFVFADDGVFLAVRQRGQSPWEVYLTHGSGAGWGEGKPVMSLAQLGDLLGPPAPEPEPEPSGPALWQSGNLYAKDVQVTWNGRIYRSLVANNTWGPPGSAGLETVWGLV